MPFLSVFGVAVPVSAQNTTSETLIKPPNTPSFNGRTISNGQKPAVTITARTTILSFADTRFYSGLLSNEFTHYPLISDSWGSGGEQNLAIGVSAVGGVFGSNYWQGNITYLRKISANWAISFWALDSILGWSHYLIQSDGNNFKAGAPTGAPFLPTVLTDRFSLNTLNNVIGFSGVTFFDFNIPTNKFAEMYSNLIQNRFLQQKLEVAGSGVASINAIGLATAQDIKGAVLNSAWANNLAEIDFILMEA